MRCSFNRRIELDLYYSELVSNAADALEKLRHNQMLDQSLETDKPLEIHISVDQAKKQFIIQVHIAS
jgi:TNF receptor-associated protein 1